MAFNRAFHTPELKRVEFLDQRFYKYGEDDYFPSVTTVLDVFPKGFGFDQWLKDVGNNASQIVERAGEQGTKIHNALEELLTDKRVTWADDKGRAKYTKKEWQMIARFVEFYTTYKPEIIAVEQQLFSPIWRVAGTLDLVCILNKLIYLIDFKSSNYLHTTHELQISAYAQMWNENCEKSGSTSFKIDRTGILWLNAQTRGEDKTGKKIQGKGWQLKDDFGRPYEKAFEIFGHTKAIWNEMNPDPKPDNLTMPDNFCIAPNQDVTIVQGEVEPAEGSII